MPKEKPEKNVLTLRPEVVLQKGREMDCPICSGLKNAAEDEVCESCQAIFGDEAIRAVDAVIGAMNEFTIWRLVHPAHAAVWESPVLAQVKITEDAYITECPKFQANMWKGFVPLHIVGIYEVEPVEENRIMALIQLMKDDMDVLYLRGQAVNGAKSNAKLDFNREAGDYQRFNLPYMHGWENGHFLSFGFVPAVKAEPVVL